MADISSTVQEQLEGWRGNPLRESAMHCARRRIARRSATDFASPSYSVAGGLVVVESLANRRRK